MIQSSFFWSCLKLESIGFDAWVYGDQSETSKGGLTNDNFG